MKRSSNTAQSLNIESTDSKVWQQLTVGKFPSDEFKNLDLTFKIQKQFWNINWPNMNLII